MKLNIEHIKKTLYVGALGEDFAKFCLDTANKAIGIALAEQSAEQYITAAQPEPVDPHAALRAEYAKQVKDGTVGFYLWEYKYGLQKEFVPLDYSCFVGGNIAMHADHNYRYTDISCMVALKGEPAKRMLRSEAQELQRSLGDTVEWTTPMYGTWRGRADLYFAQAGTYTYAPKALKQVSWSDIPQFVRVQRIDTKIAYTLLSFDEDDDLVCILKGDGTPDYIHKRNLELASEQPWMYWGGGECPVPEGCTFEITSRAGNVRSQKEVTDWTHTEHAGDIIAYRITGIAKGYVLGGAV